MLPRAWYQLHTVSPLLRWPAKWLLLACGVLLVLFPKPWLLFVLLERARDMEQLLDPDHPGLAVFEADVLERTAADAPVAELLATVEQVVRERVPYAWDWETWGVMEYLPTVDEVLARGQEDCDGRAVVAASLLRRMGHEAWLVSDIVHMWVQTRDGETMSPGGVVTLVAAEPGASGTQTAVTLDLLANLVRGTAFGVSVFPLTREVALLLLVCALTWHPRVGLWRFACGALLMWIGLDWLRRVGQTAAVAGGAGPISAALAATALIACGWLVMAMKRRSVAGAVDYSGRSAARF